MEELINELKQAEEEYYMSKCDLDLMKAQLWINTDFVAVFNKAKPTEKDKRSWITIEVAEVEEKVKLDYANYQHLLRLFELRSKE